MRFEEEGGGGGTDGARYTFVIVQPVQRHDKCVEIGSQSEHFITQLLLLSR